MVVQQWCLQEGDGVAHRPPVGPTSRRGEFKKLIHPWRVLVRWHGFEGRHLLVRRREVWPIGCHVWNFWWQLSHFLGHTNQSTQLSDNKMKRWMKKNKNERENYIYKPTNTKLTCVLWLSMHIYIYTCNVCVYIYIYMHIKSNTPKMREEMKKGVHMIWHRQIKPNEPLRL